MKEYTAKEVAKHTTESDCWVIMHGKVYDVTKFLDDHPGGADVIMDYAGEDCTEAFEEIFHSDKAKKQADDEFLIGTLKKSAGDAGKSEGKVRTYKDDTRFGQFYIPLLLGGIGAALVWRFADSLF
ncbi:MAG: hypothetical protein MHM6MM_006892 [Cercozoa sp. M6MM]